MTENIFAANRQCDTGFERATELSINDAKEFLHRLDPHTTRFCFRTFTDSKPKPAVDLLAGNLNGSIEECWPTLASRNAAGAGVYVVVNEGGHTHSDIKTVRAIFLDLDGSPIEPVAKVMPTPHLQVQSSPGRWHIYWIVDGLHLLQFSAVQKELAKRFSGDAAVHDLSRVMRLPGFLHRKTTPFLCRLESCQNNRPPYFAGFLLNKLGVELSAQPEPISEVSGGLGAAVVQVDDSVVAELRNALTFLPSDNRDDWIAIGCALRNLGEIGLGLWLEWSKKSHKYDEAGALNTWHTLAADRTGYQAVFAKAARSGWCNPAKARLPLFNSNSSYRGIKFARASEILKDVSPIPWLIRGYLAQDSLCSLVGQSNSGKTFVALDWACCVATGRNWCGANVRQGGVFYLAGEGRYGLRLRLKAWQQAFCSLAEAPFFVSDGAALLTNRLEADAVYNECQRISSKYGTRPALIVIDTLARNYGGDENSAADMSRFISNLDTSLRTPWGCSVLIVHHVGLGEEAQKRGRGSSALRAALDSEFVLLKSGPAMTLNCSKAKDWEAPEPVPLELREVSLAMSEACDESVSSCVVDPSTALLVANMRGMGKNSEALLKLLKVMRDEFVAKNPGLGGVPTRLPVQTVRQQAVVAGLFGHPTRFREALEGLERRGLVAKESNCLILLN